MQRWKTLPMMSSILWCRHAKERSSPSFCSRIMHALIFFPVFWSSCVKTHSNYLVYNAPVYQSSSIYCGSLCFCSSWWKLSCSHQLSPFPDTSTGSRSTFSFPVVSCRSFPSQWTTQGTSLLNSSRSRCPGPMFLSKASNGRPVDCKFSNVVA